MTKVRFGLVGCGRLGAGAEDNVARWAVADHWLPYSHAAAIRQAPECELVAVCDVSPEAVASARTRHEVAHGYQDYSQMFAEQQLDAVAIATRTAARPEIIRAALESGIRGFYCEKPLTNTLEEADELAALIKNAGAHFVYGTKRWFMPTFERVRSEIESGRIGEIKSIVIRLGFGSLLWTYPHAVDLAAFFMREQRVDSVQASLVFDEASVLGNVVDADPSVRSALINFSGGVTAVILPGGGMDTEIVGSDGVATIEGDGAAVRWRRRLTDGSDFGWLLDCTSDPRMPPSSGTLRGIKALAAAVTTARHPGYSIEAAVRNQEVLFGFVESHLAGCAPIAVPVRRRGLVITGRTGDLYA